MTTRPHASSVGFTLIETLISVALLGLLMGIALPQMDRYWQQSRRQDAQNSLLQLHIKQLQWRGLHPQYSILLSELAWPGTLTLAGHYSLSLEATGSGSGTGASTGMGTQGYVLHATAIGLQARDTSCSVMTLRYTENSALLKTSNGAMQNDPGRCWKW